jgi:hypothetical protein
MVIYLNTTKIIYLVNTKEFLCFTKNSFCFHKKSVICSLTFDVATGYMHMHVHTHMHAG